jgi:hypothetical protein
MEEMEGRAPEPTEAQEASASASVEAEPPRADGDLARLIKSLREENAKWRRRLREVEEALERERESAQKRLSEAERALIQKERELKEREVKAAIREAALRAGAVDPDAAYALADLSLVEWGESGPDVSKVIEDLREKRSFLFRAAPQIPTPNPSRAATFFKRSQLADRAFWEANREEIERAIREGRILDE